jgi:hypothetical protein
MQTEDAEGSPSLASTRVLEIIVALLFIGASVVVVLESLKLGVSWIEGQGPAPGYFPFYVAVAMGLASLVTLLRAIMNSDGNADESFVSRAAFGRVMAVLIPTALYVLAIGGLNHGPLKFPGIGIYVASAIFIAIFMLVFGRENILKAIAVGIAIPVALFLMFERWFLVPLPKGPLEAALGLG